MSSFPTRLANMQPFFGTWYLDELLGQGSYGQVFRVRRKEFDKVYYAALKWVPVPQNEQEPLQHIQTGADEASIRAYYRDMVSTLQNELVLMSALRGNSNVVSYDDHLIVERKDSIGYDVLMRMELLTPLPQLIGKGMRVKDAVALGLDLCSALMLCEKMHIVHRDIKPDNIFVSEFGHYKLGDFGVARQMEMTQGAMSRKGTPHYMAPELMVGGQSGKAVDQYSLGLVLHNLLNGHRIPFVDVSSRLPTVAERDEAYRRRMMGEAIPPPILGSSMLKQVVCKTASYQAQDRYLSAEMLREALQSCQADMRDETPLNTAHMMGRAQEQERRPQAVQVDPSEERTIPQPGPQLNRQAQPTEENQKAARSAQSTPAGSRPRSDAGSVPAPAQRNLNGSRFGAFKDKMASVTRNPLLVTLAVLVLAILFPGFYLLPLIAALGWRTYQASRKDTLR